MTVENQIPVVDQENVYRGKKWGMGKLVGIVAAICGVSFIRDLLMGFVYGSIYDSVAEEGMDGAVSFLHYVIMVILFALPLIFPFVLRFTKGAYFDEPENSLVPAMGKFMTIATYVLVGLVAVVPVALTMIGVFTPAYMFVAANMALVIFSNIVLFYYLGTYFLQRFKASLSQKYFMPTVFMIVSNVVSAALTIGATLLLDSVLSNGEESGVAIVGHAKAYIESATMDKLLVPALIMIGMVSVAVVVSGLLYHMTQNILYSAVPTFVLAYSNVVLIQRINEATSNIAKWTKDIENYSKRPTSSNAAKIEELQAKIPAEEMNITICYVFIGIMAFLLLCVGVRAIIGMVKNKKEAKN